MTLSALIKTPYRSQQPAEIDIRKVAMLLEENRRRAENILLSINLSFPSEVARIESLSRDSRNLS